MNTTVPLYHENHIADSIFSLIAEGYWSSSAIHRWTCSSS